MTTVTRALPYLLIASTLAVVAGASWWAATMHPAAGLLAGGLITAAACIGLPLLIETDDDTEADQ